MFTSNTPTINALNFRKYQVASFAEIWESLKTGEKSLHSLVKFMPGDTIAKLGVKDILDQPNYLTVQVGAQKHIMLDPEFLQYINHSCDPNVFFDTKNMIVTCLRKIDIGNAMTFFYPSTEWSMNQSFDCLCGSEKCIGKIQGAAHLSLNVLHNYSLTEHIKRQACEVIEN